MQVSDWCYFQTLKEYTSRDRLIGDNHGQTPMLWSAAALMRDARRRHMGVLPRRSHGGRGELIFPG